jgi:conjugal transfer pilus assembly protein TrbC
MILPIFLFSFSALNMSCPQDNACSARLQEDALKVVESVQKDKDFQSFLSDSLRQKDAVLKDTEFQDFVADLQEHAETSLQTPQFQQGTRDKVNSGNPSGQMPKGMLYIFVSFSLGEKALLNLAQEAKPYGATFVLRGFVDGSYAKTVQALQNISIKTGQGFIIDPELFSLFAVTAVPTYVLAKPFQLQAQMRTQSPLHDRLQGHVSVLYALETFAQSGDLRDEAQALLNKRRVK